MAIGVMMIVAVEITAFGNQTSLTSSSLATSVVGDARTLIEEQQSLARQDFNLVNPTSTVGEYTKSISVTLLPDFVTKLVTAQIMLPSNPAIDTTYSTLVTNLENVNAPDTCDSTPSGDWTHPHISSFLLTDLIATTTGPYSISDIDAYKGKLYVAVDRRPYKSDPAFIIFDIENAAHPSLVGKFNNNWSSASGLTAVRVAEDHANGKLSAFAASKDSYQLQIIDATVPATPSLLASTSVADGNGDGNSIFYHDGYAYLGLSSSANHPEFYVIDVRDPRHPGQPLFWPSSGNIGKVINAILVRNGYAYLAHGASATYAEQVTVLDVKDPSSAPYRVSGFFSPGGALSNSGNGKSLALVGNSLYLGRTASNASGAQDSIPEFLIIDDSNPNAVENTPLGVSTLSTGDSLNKLIIRDYVAFEITKSRLRIFRINDVAHITEIASSSLPVSGGSAEPSADCEGNTLYVGSNDAAGNGWISILTPGN